MNQGPPPPDQANRKTVIDNYVPKVSPGFGYVDDFWKRYDELADRSDREMVSNLNGNLDVLLIFVSSFHRNRRCLLIEINATARPVYHRVPRPVCFPRCLPRSTSSRTNSSDRLDQKSLTTLCGRPSSVLGAPTLQAQKQSAKRHPQGRSPDG